MTDNLPGVSPVVQDEDSKDNIIRDDAPTTVVGGMAKEQVETGPISYGETAPVVELREDEKVPEDVESWMEKLEQGEEIRLPQPVTDDDQVVVSNSGNDVADDALVLPLTEKQVEEGLHKKVYNSARWLAEWCIRVAKKLHGQIIYRAQPIKEDN
jgi:hypothetical protein